MTKRLLSLLFSLSMVTQITVAKRSEEGLKSEKCGGPVSSCFNNQPICCEPGKRGKRGPRGPRGHTGPAGMNADPGVNEFFINAVMMFFGEDEGGIPFSPDVESIYGEFPELPFWIIDIDSDPIGMNFNVPDDLDNTKPVTAVLHLLVGDFEQTPGNAQYLIQVDYQPNNGLITGTFADTEPSGDFAVNPPPSGQWRQISVPVLLNNTLVVPGDWAFMTVGRIDAITNEYEGDVLISTVSIQYHRLP